MSIVSLILTSPHLSYQQCHVQSIVVFGQLWGLICCHSYGDHGMRVSFPVRQMLRLLGDSISRNIERLSYTQRLHTRKLVSIRLYIRLRRSLHMLMFEHALD